jgi:hypothetical protein
MIILALAKHLVWSRRDGHGGIMTLYYYDEMNWIVAALAIALLTWFFVKRYQRMRALRRLRRPNNYRILKRVVKIKNDLSERYLRPGFSSSIHAVGIGKLGGADDYCIQVFVDDANKELWAGAGTASLPQSYRGVPLVLIEMPMAGFLSVGTQNVAAPLEQYCEGIREQQDVIVGGISGANSNLTGESGTIGYFCTRRSRFSRRKEIHLLSNSHVFADLRKTTVDEGDLIMQPSPGEPASSRPVGSLVNFAPLKFAGDVSDANHVDAAIARLWEAERHDSVIPMIGAIKGHVEKRDVEIGEGARKFGRTTGYTEGTVFSICLDIWIRYDRTGQSAYFQNQFLIEPCVPKFTKFVDKGDSGSLVVDKNQHAIGLIFGGMAELPESQTTPAPLETNQPDSAASRPKRVESYGVANPISEVLERMKIELLV